MTDAEASADVILLKMFPHFTEGDLEIAWSPTDRSGGVFEWEDPDTHDMVFGVNKFEWNLDEFEWSPGQQDESMQNAIEGG